MGTCIEKLPHSCGSRDGLQVFEAEDGSYNGYCYPCSTFVANPYKDKPKDYKPPQPIRKTPEQIAEEIEEIEQCVSLAIPDRKLKQSTLEHFGVKVGVSEVDGETPTILYRPYYKDSIIQAYKCKVLGQKGGWSVGDQRDVDLFGWEQAIAAGAKNLLITEGEEDAMALWQVLVDSNKGTAYEKFFPAVVSIPHGASAAAKDLLKLKEKISETFTNIVLVFDSDKPGKEAAEAVCRSVFPQAKVAVLPEKDANKCLTEGKSKALKAAVLFNAAAPKNTRIVKGSSLRKAACTRPEWGLSWPWQALTELTRGIRRKETIYIGAGVKMGKSEVVDTIGAHLMVEHDLPVLYCKPEQAMARTYQMLVGKVAGRIFHDPKIEFDQEAFDRAEEKIGDKALIIDNYQFVNWDALKEDIRYSVVGEGVKDVILDPITCFTAGMSASEANEFLVGMAAEISAMTQDLDFTSYMFCHLKAPTTGDPHERGGKIFSNQFAGSRGMMRSCNYMMALSGNKDPELTVEERNMRAIEVLEDREFGSVGSVPLYWDFKTGLFNEVA